MQHTIPHGLDQELVRKATRKALDTYQARFAEYKPQQQWLGPDRAEIQFSVAGKTLKGFVQILPKEIALDLDVPMLFAPFRGKALKVIEGEILEWIQKARAGELD